MTADIHMYDANLLGLSRHCFTRAAGTENAIHEQQC